jgi:hypothetical protein
VLLKIQFLWDVTLYRWCVVLDIQGQAAWRRRRYNPSKLQTLHTNNSRHMVHLSKLSGF